MEAIHHQVVFALSYFHISLINFLPCDYNVSSYILHKINILFQKNSRINRCIIVVQDGIHKEQEFVFFLKQSYVA